MFAALVRRWNPRINLVGRNDLAALHRRHIGDSLRLLPLLPPERDIVDLGSGAGFPGLVLAIATGRHATLIEADQRKAAFLREAARETGTRVTVIAERIERCGVAAAGLVTARALAPLEDLLALAHPLLAPSGICLFPKGASLAAELTAAERRWQMQVVAHPAGRDEPGSILEVRHLRPVQPPGTRPPGS